MKVYTREGDSGLSSVIGSKKKIPKSDPIFELLGLCDEINAVLGCALSTMKKGPETSLVERLQEDIFYIGSFLAGQKPVPEDKAVWADKVNYMERKLDVYSLKLPVIKAFVLPGGTPAASQLHMARVKVRELERRMVFYTTRYSKSRLNFLLSYINRLSDLLFVLARYINKINKKEERLWRFKK